VDECAHRYDDFRKIQMETFEKIVEDEGQKILGWLKFPSTSQQSEKVQKQ
jgi:hypothetical protein